MKFKFCRRKTLNFFAISLFMCSIYSCTQKQEVVILTDKIVDQNWQFKQADSSEWLPAIVPGCVHTDLLANKKIEDPFYRTNERNQQWIDKKDWEYKSLFSIDKETSLKNNLEIYFEGLDTYADVYVNDSLVLKADNMFREWTVDVKKYVKEGENNLRIYFHSPINIGLEKLKKFGFDLPATNDQSENGGLGDKKVSIFTRKAGYHYGWDWGPRFVTSGIWRPIHLLAWNNARIEHVQIVQNEVSKEKASLNAIVEINSAINGKVQITISSQTDPSITAKTSANVKIGMNKAELSFEVVNPKLWWTNGLGESFLYKISSELKIDDKIIDKKETNIGLRTVKIIQKPDSLGSSFYVELNGVPVFMKGANYIPNDNFLNRVTPEVYDKVVQSAVKTHMNMLRVWGGGIYENNYFYDLCDKSGILLWQDFMFACSMYPGDDAFLENIRQEAIQNVKRLRNHPSIAIWVGNNEIDVAWQQNNPNGGWGWKQKYTAEQRNKVWKAYDTIFHKILPAVISENDPQRFYWPSSPLAGWNKHSDFAAHSGDIHYWDVWWGQKPFNEYRTHIGRFMSEYGFQSFPEFNTVKTYTVPQDYDIFSDVMKAHQRSSIGNGTIKNYMQRDYKVPTDFRKFLYVGQVLQAEGIKTAMEAHRSRMPYCMGSLFWQINDCWPVASWSSIDYYGRWKAQQYFAQKAFRDVLVSPQLDSTKINIYMVSDLLENKNVKLSLKVLDFSGKVVFEKTLPLELKANTSSLYFTDDVKNILSGSSTKNVLLSTKVIDGEKVLAENILYFMAIKDVTLPKSSVHKTIKEVNGEFVLELKADKLVKNLYLSLEEGDGFFNDNYFDILPGETSVIYFKPVKGLDIKTFEKNLKMMQMSDM